MSDISSSIEGVDDIYNEIMYHVLGQFLVTKDNKNIATVLDDLTSELKAIRKLLSKTKINSEVNTKNRVEETTSSQIGQINITDESTSSASVNSPSDNSSSLKVDVVEEN